MPLLRSSGSGSANIYSDDDAVDAVDDDDNDNDYNDDDGDDDRAVF